MECRKHGGCRNGAHDCTEFTIHETGATAHKCSRCGRRWWHKDHPGFVPGWVPA